MAQDPLVIPSVWRLFLSDPVLLVGSLLPLVIMGAVIWQRIRGWHRVNAMAARNERRFDQTREQTAVQWREAAERNERIIALLTDIRDQLTRIAPPGALGEVRAGSPGQDGAPSA